MTSIPADDSIEAVLAAFAASFPFDAIAPAAIAHTKTLLIDAVGCALIGELATELDGVRSAAAAVFGPGDSTVIGSQTTLSAAGATMLNGYLMTAMTICDVYRPAHCHMTPLVIPPALAAGEETGASGEEFLTAIAIGMEVMARVARGLDYPAFRARGWHSPGVIGPLGAAAAVGRLAGQDQITIRHAFGLAASQAGGSYLSWGTPAVKFHQARGAVSGLLASRLAGNGFPGGQFPLTAPDGGIYNTHSNGGQPLRAVEKLGESWELEQISVRLWPGASPVQAMLTAIFDLIETEGVTADSVERIQIGISTEDFGTHAGFALPTNAFEALLSYAFLASAALRDRQVWFEQVDQAHLQDPRLRAFAADKVSVVEVADLPVNGCTLGVSLSDGRSLSRRVQASRGTPENPALASEVEAKFHRCAEPKLGAARTSELLSALKGIESLSDLRSLASLIRG